MADMFEKYRAKRNLNALYKDRDREFQKKREAGELQQYDDYAKWSLDWDVGIDEVKIEYDKLVTAYWREKAVNKLVELPPRDKEADLGGDGYWEERLWSGWVLSDKGIFYVRSAVRQEDLAGSEFYFRSATLAFAAVAAIAAIVAAIK